VSDEEGQGFDKLSPNGTHMIPLLLLAAEPVAATSQSQFEQCAALAASDPARALEAAGAWRVTGGGVLARHCEALAYVAQKRWLPAATAFEAAARAADTAADGRAGNFWVQAGNAALAAGEPLRARIAFDAALVRGQAAGLDLGEIHLDRARARFALGDKAGARTDLDMALKLAPADPLAWLLSATLARRSGDLDRAMTDIEEAQKRSPDDAQVALEAGNIAILSGSEAAARTAWGAAVKTAPDSPAGKAAAEALARLGSPS
jgi:tetratricopeptide (TPR) repeat protein